MSLARPYPKDFDDGELRTSDITFVFTLAIDVRVDVCLSSLSNICEVSQKMMETKTNICFPLVCRLLKLALVLLVAIATFEISLFTYNNCENIFA